MGPSWSQATLRTAETRRQRTAETELSAGRLETRERNRHSGHRRKTSPEGWACDSEIWCRNLQTEPTPFLRVGADRPPEDRACALRSSRSASPLPLPWHRLRPNPNKSNRPTLSTALAALCCLMTIRVNFSRRAGPARSPLAAAARRRLVLKGSLRLACRQRPTVHQRASLIRSNAMQNLFAVAFHRGFPAKEQVVNGAQFGPNQPHSAVLMPSLFVKASLREKLRILGQAPSLLQRSVGGTAEPMEET
jgi:hypothetical protein